LPRTWSSAPVRAHHRDETLTATATAPRPSGRSGKGDEARAFNRGGT
jgi:hypothetical protein